MTTKNAQTARFGCKKSKGASILTVSAGQPFAINAELNSHLTLAEKVKF